MAWPAVHGGRMNLQRVGRGRPAEPQEGIAWLRGQAAVFIGETAEAQLALESPGSGLRFTNRRKEEAEEAHEWHTVARCGQWHW
jgi:hypothetical protein